MSQSQSKIEEIQENPIDVEKRLNVSRAQYQTKKVF